MVVTYEVRLTTEAIEDLNRHKRENKETYERLIVFFRDFLTDPEILRDLAVPGTKKPPIKNVMKVRSFQNIGCEVFRLKLMGMEILAGLDAYFLNHRIFYAFEDGPKILWILGILHRGEYDYDLDTENGRRITQAYDKLKLPSYPVH